MIGETIADAENPIAIETIAIDEPTVSMIFGVNTSPFAGSDGQFVTSRQIKDRLDKELIGNVSIRVEPTDTPEQMKVVGRGELQLSILIEMMRREGYELQVSRPEIVTKEINGTRMEPVEELVVDVAEEYPGDGHRPGRHAQGHDDAHDQPRQRPDSAGVPHTGARPHRLPHAVS
jgi:GTP-binding protein